MKPENKEKLIVLTGPTGVGKTALSVRLARDIGAEIISADSMQVYRRMDIGTAKIRKEEMRGVRHHLIDVLEPDEPFHVMRFQQMALRAIDEIRGRGNIPMLVGGTGFYIQAVLYGIDFTETDEDDTIRRQYEERVRNEGDVAIDALYEQLQIADPDAAEAIPKQNVKRVIRALEYYDKTGTPISAHNRREREKESPYDFRYFVLTDDRERLYERVNARVDEMMEQGLPGEVRALLASGVTMDMTSMQGLGYREIARHLAGDFDRDEAVRRIKQNTRHFVKRQLTWFRRERDVILLDKRDYEYDEDRILEAIKKRLP
ncbi:MAG: tRNA (adenosine(37)-N6)-dimethylallyltransferase MiaA [Lachnospiraceae bacterium]|nr:tRNA (adenosine(37)-N6)-dimethylallyltransferase MiaA [Lachnospiraceae bacterium]